MVPDSMVGDRAGKATLMWGGKEEKGLCDQTLGEILSNI